MDTRNKAFGILGTLALLLGWPSLPAAAQVDVSVAGKLPNRGANAHYAGNRAPLLASPLIKLPVGSVRPEGWIRHQLELMAEGFIGHLPQLSRFCKYEGSAWTDPEGHGQLGWEEVPYWLRGFTSLGYLLQDDRIISESRQWLDAIIATQRPNGYFGSEDNLRLDRYTANWPFLPEVIDLWPNMIVLYALRTQFEATGDERILPLMTNYFRWVHTIPLDRLLVGRVQHWRAGDQLDSIYWLYNRTGDAWLLEVARANHDRTANWMGNVPYWHGVNMSQGFREPAQFYQQTKDTRYLKATEKTYNIIMSLYGQAPGGMFAADERARPGFTGSRQAAESCSMAELMNSHAMLAAITGDPVWADRMEEIAFNSYPASMTPDLKGLHYLTAPNQVRLDRQSKAPMVNNGGDQFSYNPYRYRCCQHNLGLGWTKFAERLWMATPGNGLAAVFYAPGRVTATVADGAEVTITETTDYPFGETVEFDVSSRAAVRFPLTLRIPGWCEQPEVLLNGKSVPLPGRARGWIVLDRRWAGGDHIELRLPMKIRVGRFPLNKSAASVVRGPLAYSLKIGERWQPYETPGDWKGYEVFPTTPWNYGLILDPDGAEASFEVIQSGGALAPQPFTPQAAPITLRAKGKRIPQWGMEPNGMIEEIQDSPVRSDEPVEDIELIPMGCARLRLSMFPVIGEAPRTRVWKDSVPLVTASNTELSYFAPLSTHRTPPTAVNDGLIAGAAGVSSGPASDSPIPASGSPGPAGTSPGLADASPVPASGSPGLAGTSPVPAGASPVPAGASLIPAGTSPIPRFTWGLPRERQEWIQYTFATPRQISRTEVHWLVDSAQRSLYVPPESWRLKWLDGKDWKDVEANSDYAIEGSLSRIIFRPITTTAIRLEVELRPRRSAGILEWRVE